MRPFLFLLIPVFALACKKPPEAPATLDDLCGYLYGHFLDEDTEALEVGLENLDNWLLQNIEATKEGYSVTNLASETVNAIDDREHDLEGLVGAAVGTEGPYTPQALADTLILVPPTELSPGMYVTYDRTYLPGGDEGKRNAQCFVDQECEFLEVDNVMSSTYLLGLTVDTSTHGQYRWVETVEGQAMLQRTWLSAAAELNFDWIAVDDQFFLNVIVPRDDGAVRLTATWIVARFIGVDMPEGTALNMVIDQMMSIYVDVDAWLAAEG